MKVNRAVHRGAIAVCFAVVLSTVVACEPSARALEPGDILVADSHTDALIRIDGATGEQAVMSSDGSFEDPVGVAVEEDGQVLVADMRAFGGVGAVIRVDPATGDQATVATGGLLFQPYGIALEADGDILVTDRPGILRIDPVSGTQTRVTSGHALSRLFGIDVASDGVIFVSLGRGGGTGAVLRVDPLSGTEETVSSAGELDLPHSLALEFDGDILVADGNCCEAGGAIRVDPATGAQAVVASGFIDGYPMAVAVDANGDLLLTIARLGLNSGVARVLRIGSDGRQSVVSTEGLLDDPLGITVVPGSSGPTTKEDCRNGGWRRDEFRNQGSCITAVKRTELLDR